MDYIEWQLKQLTAGRHGARALDNPPAQLDMAQAAQAKRKVKGSRRKKPVLSLT